MEIEAVTNCYHWLMCLSIFFNYSPDTINPANAQMVNSSVLSPMSQGWAEYECGFNERCPRSEVERIRRQPCYQRARQRLRNWLDRQTEVCLKTKVPTNSSTSPRFCRPSADAVFSYIVRYRESE